MTKNLNINEKDFEKFLHWLDKNREKAGQKYELIRDKLVQIFYARGCLIGEELADECIDRVIKKIDTLAKTYEGDPALYFYGVAKYVFLEYTRKAKTEELPEIVAQTENTETDNETDLKCLDDCLKKLNAEQRDLILGYYENKKIPKKERGKIIEKDLKITNENLRVRIFRIKKILKKCIEDCIKENSDETI